MKIYKKILVTGGEGYVGSNLIKKLLVEGHKVVSIDNDPKPKNRHDGAEYIRLDSKDINRYFVEEDVLFDVVFHFGEYSRIRSSFNDVDTIMNGNFLGTYEVVNYCKQRNVKLIYSATSSSFGGNENLSPYSWQKTKCVELIKNYQNWFGTFTSSICGQETPHLRYGIAYFYNVYGKNHIKTGKMATVIGIFEDALEKGLPIPVINKGHQSRDFTHIDDIVEGLYNIFTHEQYKDSGEYHLGTGVNHKIIDIAKMFSDSIQYLPKTNGERLSSLMPKHTMPTWWKPQINIKEYIKELKVSETL